jgi:hypothetical protein
MQSLLFQNDNSQFQRKLISKNQSVFTNRGGIRFAVVREAVNVWQESLPGKSQETITKLVVAEWHRRGGKGLNLAGSLQNAKQNLFRWLDNPRNSEKYERYVSTLLPVIADVMPIEIARQYGLKQGLTDAEIVANAVKECGEAHHAKLMGLPIEKLEKEVREAAEALLKLLPIESMAQVASGLVVLVPGLI